MSPKLLYFSQSLRFFWPGAGSWQAAPLPPPPSLPAPACFSIVMYISSGYLLGVWHLTFVDMSRKHFTCQHHSANQIQLQLQWFHTFLVWPHLSHTGHPENKEQWGSGQLWKYTTLHERFMAKRWIFKSRNLFSACLTITLSFLHYFPASNNTGIQLITISFMVQTWLIAWVTLKVLFWALKEPGYHGENVCDQVNSRLSHNIYWQCHKASYSLDYLGSLTQMQPLPIAMLLNLSLRWNPMGYPLLYRIYGLNVYQLCLWPWQKLHLTCDEPVNVP